MKLLKIAISIALTINLFAATPEKVLFLPWGNSQESVKYREEPAYRFGPQNFQVSKNDIAIIDPVNRAVKYFEKGRLKKQRRISAATKDFATLNQMGIAKPVAETDGHVKLINQHSAEIRFNTGRIITVNHGNPHLASIRYLGADQQDRYYVDVNIITNQIPLAVTRKVQILDNQGNKMGEILIPDHYFTKLYDDLKVDPGGLLYHMISSHDGIHVFKWETNQIIGEKNNRYPQQFYRKLSFHTDLESRHSTENYSEPKTLATITREQTLAIDGQETGLTATYQLQKNYPNPFNPATTISYQIPEAGRVKLQIYNIAGQLVQTLQNTQKTAGIYQFQWEANDQSSGVYFYTLSVFDPLSQQLRYTKTEKCILLK